MQYKKIDLDNGPTLHGIGAAVLAAMFAALAIFFICLKIGEVGSFGEFPWIDTLAPMYPIPVIGAAYAWYYSIYQSEQIKSVSK